MNTEEKLPAYVNRFQLSVNPVGMEVQIAFLQEFPDLSVDLENNGASSIKSVEVSRLVMSLNTAKDIAKVLGGIIERAEQDIKGQEGSADE